MKRLIAFVAVAAMTLMMLPGRMSAQNPQISAEEQKALDSADWYIPLSYGGFNFEIPAGSIVDKGSKITVKYPDGSFGMSMENEEFRGGSQKIAYEKARSYAKRYELKDAEVSKVTVGGVKGAKAVGQLENHQVTVIILPVNEQQVTTVLMATPNRTDWVNHFVQTMSR